MVIAAHGGAIEPGTSELAEAIAGEEHACYTFSGEKAAGNGVLHITSARFDEPRCLELIGGCDQLVALHGCRGDEDAVYLGGRDEALKQVLATSLGAAGFRVAPPQDEQLQGLHPANICNRSRSGQGAQLELTRGLRRSLFVGLNSAGREQPTERLSVFVAAVREALSQPRSE